MNIEEKLIYEKIRYHNNNKNWFIVSLRDEKIFVIDMYDDFYNQIVAYKEILWDDSYINRNLAYEIMRSQSAFTTLLHLCSLWDEIFNITHEEMFDYWEKFRNAINDMFYVEK